MSGRYGIMYRYKTEEETIWQYCNRIQCGLLTGRYDMSMSLIIIDIIFKASVILMRDDYMPVVESVHNWCSQDILLYIMLLLILEEVSLASSFVLFCSGILVNLSFVVCKKQQCLSFPAQK
jgi:hypothetical protein